MRHYVFLILFFLEVLSINSRTLNNPTGYRIIGENSYAADSVSAGDINGDGYTDLVVSHPRVVSGTESSVFVVYGGPTDSLKDVHLALLTEDQGFEIKGFDTNSYGDVSAVDLNNDGYADLVIGGFAGNGESSQKTSTFIIFGGPSLQDVNIRTMSSSQGIKITGTEFGDYFGGSIRAAGDVNGDGYEDVIIGASQDKNEVGAAYVVYGGPSLTSFSINSLDDTQGFKIEGDSSGKYSFGTSVSSAGDINQDGYADLLIGAAYFSYDVPQTFGFAYVVYGGESLTTINVGEMTKEQGFTMTNIPSTSFGAAVSSAGDVNNDGYPDIMVGAPQEDSYTGAVYVIYGGSDLTNMNVSKMEESQGIKIMGTYTPNYNYWPYFGLHLSGVGDINNDGYADMVITAPNEWGYQNRSDGNVYVAYGGSSLTSFYVKDMTSEEGYVVLYPATPTSSNFGVSVSPAGDVNKDGYADFIVGTRGAGAVLPGFAYVVLGGPTQ